MTSTSETKPIKLLLVDDHEVLRIGLRTLFTEAGNFQVVGEAGTMAAAVAEALRLKPNVVLMDVRLPDGSGIDACRTIRTAHPDTRVLFLTSFADDDAVLATILAGADGFLLKEVTSEQLIDAVKSRVARTVNPGPGRHPARARQSAVARDAGLTGRNGSRCRRKKNASWH